MEKKGTPLNRRKSTRKSVVTPCETKQAHNTPPAQKTPIEKLIHHPRKRNLNSQKEGETDKENSTELLNSVNLNNTFGTNTPKDTPKPSFSSVRFDLTANEGYKISTDSDIEFSDRMKQRKQINVEINNTGFDLNNRKSVRFMPTETLICPSYMTADVMKDMTPEKLEDVKSIVERYDGSRKCAKRKSTPFVKRSKSSVITIDSTTTESDMSISSQNQPNNSPVSQSSTTPMQTSTKKHGSRVAREKPTEHIATESTPYVRSIARDRPKRISRSPKKYSCINLVTPSSSKTQHSLRREGTFLVDSPSFVVMDDTKSKIQDSFNESKTDSNSTKRQRKKWDKSVGFNISSFSNLEEKPSPKKMRKEGQRKQWNKSFENSGFSPLKNEAGPSTVGDIPTWFDEFFENNTKASDKSKKYFSSTPLPPRSGIPFESRYPKNLVIHQMVQKKMSAEAIRAKIPDFIRIHKKNFDKMENIKDHVERKAKRAELLLSGKKPPQPDSSPKASDIRKNLNYSPKEQSATGVSANSGSKINVNPSVKTGNKFTGVKKASKPVVKKVEEARADRKILKPKRRSLENQKNGFTRFGFRVGREGVKKVSKDEQAKAVATKTKVGATTTDKRRFLTQNVRTNRRFELLMQMRKKNK